jgi:hypothetical protein
MSVNQTWREVRAGEINHFRRLVIAEPDYTTIVHRNVGRMDFAAENVDQVRVLEKEFSRTFAARDAEFVPKVSHDRFE